MTQKKVDEFNEKKLRKLEVFRNSYAVHHAGLVELDIESKRKAYFNVQDANSAKLHSVIIEFDSDNKVLTAKCDCTIASLKSKYRPICSHIINALVRGMYDFGRPTERQRKRIAAREDSL